MYLLETNAFTRLEDIANGYIRNNLERENFEIAGIGRDGLDTPNKNFSSWKETKNETFTTNDTERGIGEMRLTS